MKKIEKYINEMKVSEYKGVMNNKHMAVAIKEGKIITDFKYNLHKTFVLGEYKGTMHAEMSVVYQLLKDIGGALIGYRNYFSFINCKKRNYERKLEKKLSNISIIVIRLSPAGELLNSKPCYDCIHTLKMLGLKKIYYSSGDIKNPIIMEKITDIQNLHKSQMARRIDCLLF